MPSIIGTSEGNKQIKKMFFGTDSWKDSKSIYYGESSGWVKLFSGIQTTFWRYYNAGGMYTASSTNATSFSYQNRVRNLDSETISEIIIDFGSIYSSGAPLIGAAVSFGGTGDLPGPGGWHRITFGGQLGFSYPLSGSVKEPKLVSSDPIIIPGGLAPGASMLIRVGYAAGLVIAQSKSIATEISWPSNNKRYAGDVVSTDQLLEQNPAWTGTSYAPSWYAIRVKRVTPKPMILVHGDSVATQVRPIAATNTSSGYGWIMRINEMTESYHIVSMGIGGSSMQDSEDRTPELLETHKDYITHMMIQSWSGNGSPVSIADCERIKTNIINMETAILAAGKKVICVTLKPHGGTISTQGERDAYWHMVDWANERYGINHINLSQEITLSNDGGMTLLNSEDNVHFNAIGQLAQANALKPHLDAALISDGYDI
jgi:lysophospholipase L1-like esterase